MTDQNEPRRRGNPAWVKGGASPNPRGRPRTGLACAEKIRERVDPGDWIDFELAIATDAQKPIAERRASWLALIDRGFVKPATQHDLNVTSTTGARDYSHLSDAEVDAELERLERLALPADHADDPKSSGIDAESAE